MLLSACCGLFMMASCGPSSAPADGGLDAGDQEVVAVVHDFLQALEAREGIRLAMALHSEATLTRIGMDGDTLRTKLMTGDEWMASVTKEGPALIERLENIEVHRSDLLADVWAYYDFHVGEELSHCGYDAFQLVKEKGQWRILGVTYTTEPCP